MGNENSSGLSAAIPTTDRNPNLKVYVGTKIIMAEPMNSIPFKIKHKGANPDVMKEEDAEGYVVTYEDGYVSWSPKEVFERCYREITEQEKRMTRVY